MADEESVPGLVPFPDPEDGRATALGRIMEGWRAAQRPLPQSPQTPAAPDPGAPISAQPGRREAR